MHTTQALAEYVCQLRPERLPEEARTAAIRCVLDLITAAAAGHSETSVNAVRVAARAQYGTGAAEVWFTGERMTPTGAALCNSAAASVLDLDDGFRPARGHPGAAVIPAALAVAAQTQPNAAEFLAAVVAGYEVGVRVACGRRMHSWSGTWSPHAAIAAAGRLRGTKPEALAHALGIATLCGPVLKGTGGSHFANPSDSDVKEGIPWGTMTGMMSLYLAEAGHTGPLEILDTPSHFDSRRILENLDGPPLIGGTYFKPYACCRHIHAPLDAFQRLMETHAIAVADIVAVEIHTYEATRALSNLTDPETLINVQYSVPFCIGICALRGKAGLLPPTADVLADAEIRAFAKRVTLHVDPAFTARFPVETPTRVVIRTNVARYESPVTTPLGDPALPLSWSDLEMKFRIATREVLTSARQEALLEAICRLRSGDLQPLRAVLGAQTT